MYDAFSPVMMPCGMASTMSVSPRLTASIWPARVSSYEAAVVGTMVGVNDRFPFLSVSVNAATNCGAIFPVWSTTATRTTFCGSIVANSTGSTRNDAITIGTTKVVMMNALRRMASVYSRRMTKTAFIAHHPRPAR
jgi:hypothetical protein